MGDTGEYTTKVYTYPDCTVTVRRPVHSTVDIKEASRKFLMNVEKEKREKEKQRQKEGKQTS